MAQSDLAGRLAGCVLKYSTNLWPKALKKREKKAVDPSIVGWVDTFLTNFYWSVVIKLHLFLLYKVNQLHRYTNPSFLDFLSI